MLLQILLIEERDTVDGVTGHLPILVGILLTKYYVTFKWLHAPTLTSHSCIMGLRILLRINSHLLQELASLTVLIIICAALRRRMVVLV